MFYFPQRIFLFVHKILLANEKNFFVQTLNSKISSTIENYNWRDIGKMNACAKFILEEIKISTMGLCVHVPDLGFWEKLHTR